MMAEEVPFGSLYAVSAKNGVSYPSRLRGAGTPMVNMRELFQFDRIRDQEMERVPLTEREARDFMLEKGDLLFARQSLVEQGAGRVVLVDDGPPRTWEGHLIRVRLRPDLADPLYFYYFFRSPIGRARIRSIIEQVAAAGIRGSDLKQLKVPLRPVTEQKSVAAVLGALDEKIQANRRLASLLENWLAAQFAQLRLDEPGPCNAKLDELVDINPSYRVPRGAEAPYIDMAAVPSDSALVATHLLRPPKSGTRFMNGDTVMARITPCLENGKTAFIDCLPPGSVGFGSTEFLVLRSKADLPALFTYFLAKTARFRDYAVQRMSGTSGRQRCSADAIRTYPIRKPVSGELSVFGDACDNALPLMRAVLNESLLLAELRDALLPKLISGELRVRDAESELESVR